MMPMYVPISNLTDFKLDNVRKMFAPSIQPIYEQPTINPFQIGTGFVLSYNNRTLLVTAGHVLFGHDFKASPNLKRLHIGKTLLRLNSEDREVNYSKEKDIAVVEMSELEEIKPLTIDNFLPAGERGKTLSILGFLSRDFKRRGRSLASKPYMYTGNAIQTADKIVMEYTHRKNLDPNTGERVVNPIPRGLSGCPMIDTTATLESNTPKIVGIFTEQDNGTARGTDILYLNQLFIS